MHVPAPNIDPSAAAPAEGGGLKDRVAVITGSTRGVGRAIAIELARHGSRIVLHGRAMSEHAQESLQAIGELGGSARFVAADLSDRATHQGFVDEAWRAFGRIDFWINNAGADVLTGEAAAWSFERKLDQLWRVDVLGTMQLSRLIGQRMRAAAAGGVIINVGWDQAEQGMAGDSGEMFSAIKGAIMAFTRSLAQTLAPDVRVNCVAPGWIQTAWGGQASHYWQERAKSESLRERWGKPEDVAQVVRFLVSQESDFMTGQIIQVNGGFRYGRKS